MTERRNPEVDAFLAERNHPLGAVVERLRTVLLDGDPRITESVKWGGPTFAFAGSGKILATITLRSAKSVTLFLQEGAGLDDPAGLLRGDASHVRTAAFASVDDVGRAAAGLAAIVQSFCRRCEAAPASRRKPNPGRSREKDQ